MKKNYFLVFLASILIHVSAFCQDGILFRNISFEEAIQNSKSEKKPIFLHAYASWCHYCQYMADSVYTDGEVGSYYNSHFICIKMDMEKDGKELNKKLRVKTFPTHVFFDTTAAIMMHRAAGKRTKPEFLELGHDALDTNKQLRTFERRYFDKRASTKDISTYFKMLDKAGLDNQITINAYLIGLSDEELMKYDNWRIMYDQFQDAEATAFQRILLLRPDYAKKYTVDSIDNKILTVYNGALMTKVQKLDTLGYNNLIEKLRKSRLEISDKIIAYAELNRFKMKSDWKNYQLAAPGFIEKYCQADYRRLNEIAYNFFERVNDPELLSKAITWSEKAVSLQDIIKYNHTLASLYFKTGDKKKAMTACQHTIEIAKRNKVDYKQSILLLEKIEALKDATESGTDKKE